MVWKILWALSLRGRRSRNKVSVGEPAEGSFACAKCTQSWMILGVVVLLWCGAIYSWAAWLADASTYCCRWGLVNVYFLWWWHLYICFGNECLSSNDDEECSEMWYALWIAKFREPIDVWTLVVPLGYAWRCVWFNVNLLSFAFVHLQCLEAMYVNADALDIRVCSFFAIHSVLCTWCLHSQLWRQCCCAVQIY